MLVTLTIATLGGIFLGLLPGWIIIPPVGMLVLYLFLLREAAHADAENAFHRAEAHARAAEAQAARAAHEARERARLAQDVPELQPTAEIIDISALAAQSGDQLYDQYADAEVRAVGD
jgi:flagellar biosynthesis component FlhA